MSKSRNDTLERGEHHERIHMLDTYSHGTQRQSVLWYVMRGVPKLRDVLHLIPREHEGFDPENDDLDRVISYGLCHAVVSMLSNVSRLITVCHVTATELFVQVVDRLKTKDSIIAQPLGGGSQSPYTAPVHPRETKVKSLQYRATRARARARARVRVRAADVAVVAGATVRVSRFDLIGLPISFLSPFLDDALTLTLVLRLSPLTHASSPYVNLYL